MKAKPWEGGKIIMKEKFARWNILFLQYLKRDWKKIIIWVLGLGMFSAGFVPAFKEIAKGQGLVGMFETLQNPAMISMVGPTPVETGADYTLGAMYAHEMLLFCGLFAMIMSILHVIGHTRKEEDLGLTELLRSFQIGRQANSLAAIAEIVFINGILALFIAVVMISFGADTISIFGSVLYGASIGMAGIIGAGIALIMAQIMPTSSAATGSSLGIVGLLYIVRAGTDVSNVELFININKGVIISWLIAYVVMGAAYGSIYGDMQTFLESNEMMKQMFSHTGFSIEESFTGTVMMVLIGLVSILPIAIVNKLFSEERRLHLSQIYATKVTRSQLYWTSIGLSILSGLLGVLLAAGSLGGTAISAMGNSGEMDIVDFFAAGFNLFPTVLFFIGLAALALGWAPKLGKIVYIYLTFSFLLNYFSGLIDLPEWFLNTAIQSWMPQMPMDDFEASVFLTVTIISIALIVIGFLGYSRRDMNEGA